MILRPPDERPARSKPRVTEEDVQGWKYFKLVNPLFERLHEVGTQRDRAGNRQLFFDQYASLILLYFFNPVFTSLRGLREATDLKKVQRVLKCPRTSFGSLSEASRVFDSDCLKSIIAELAGQLGPIARGEECKALQALTAVDGSLLPALPKMAWALWNYDDKKAAKLHLHFEVFKGAPARAKITHGKSCEKKAMHEMLEPGRLYVMDRGYEQFRLFQAIIDIGSSFICCVREQMTWQVLEQRPLSTGAQDAGVQFDYVVSLGGRKAQGVLQQPLRVIEVKTDKTNRKGKPLRLILVTDCMDLAAELIALGYRFRWHIELFFRWLKCVLGCRHLLSTSQNGVEIQVYVALIASLLISLWVGRKPTKRTLEMLCLYFQGWADADELVAHIEKLKKHQS